VAASTWSPSATSRRQQRRLTGRTPRILVDNGAVRRLNAVEDDTGLISR
jgi:hypothetical protein